MNSLQLNEKKMTSLQIAEIVEKPHNDVMKAIRKMEPAWSKINGGNFSLVNYQDAKGESRPCYSLTRTEVLFVATKFKDEARAKLVLRWEELEKEKQQNNSRLMSSEALLVAVQNLVNIEREQMAQKEQLTIVDNRTNALENKMAKMEQERKDATFDLLTAPYLSKNIDTKTSDRDMVRKLVNEYSTATGIAQQDVWHNVYMKLYYDHHISINSYKKQDGEKSNLDVVQRIGAMPQLHAIISTMVYNLKKKDKE